MYNTIAQCCTDVLVRLKRQLSSQSNPSPGPRQSLLGIRNLSCWISESLQMYDFDIFDDDFTQMSARFWFFIRSLASVRPPHKIVLTRPARVAKDLGSYFPSKADLQVCPFPQALCCVALCCVVLCCVVLCCVVLCCVVLCCVVLCCVVLC